MPRLSTVLICSLFALSTLGCGKRAGPTKPVDGTIPAAWESTDGPLGGSVLAIAVDSRGVVFAGTVGGAVFASTDGGLNWRRGAGMSPSLSAYGVYDFTVGRADTLYAAADLDLYLSTDGGANWTSLGTAGPRIFALALNTRGEVFAGGHGVARYDHGSGWSPVRLGSITVRSLAVTASGSVLAGTEFNGLYRSTDNGDTWNPVGSPTWRVFALEVMLGGTVLAGVFGYGIQSSTDNGQTWTPLSTPNSWVLALASAGADTLYAGTSFGVLRSIDAGSTWTTAGDIGREISAVAAGSAGLVFAGDVGGLARSADGGQTWSETTAGFNALLIRALASQGPGVMYAGTLWGGLHATFNSGATWQRVGQRGGTFERLLLRPNGHFLAARESGILRSTDSGANWSGTNFVDAGGGGSIVRFVATSLDSCFASTTTGLLVSGDDGLTWHHVAALGTQGDVARGPDGVLYASGTGGLYRSDDGGLNWTPKNTGLPGGASISSLVTTPSGVVLAATSQGTYRSLDRGEHWGVSSSSYGVLECGPDGTAYFTSDLVYVSKNGGASWSPIGLPTPSYIPVPLAPNPDGYLYTGVSGYGVFRTKAP